MQNNRTFHARSFFLLISSLAVLLLAGCSTPSVTNLTAPSITPNPSNIYTITARIKPRASNVVEGSTVAKVIIDGNAHKMTKLPNVPDLYEIEFQAPAGASELRYYFLVEYQTSNVGILKSRTDYSTLQSAHIVDRNALGLTANRGPAGARIAITGRGFTSHDNVYFDENLARSAYDSPNAISFYVPNLPANRNYNVSIGDTAGKLSIGTFRIDEGGSGSAQTTTTTTSYSTNVGATNYSNAAPSNYSGATGATTYNYTPMTSVQPAAAAATTTSYTTTSVSSSSSSSQSGALAVSPTEIKIHQGSTQVVKFITPFVVKGSPVLIDITTDIADSVIMPEVYVYDGSNIGSVTIEGGRPGTGHLYAKLPGSAKPLIIPVTVRGSN